LRGNFVQSGLTVKLAHSNKGFRVITKPGRGFGKINTIESAGLLTFTMTHVVTENCIKCKFTDCVDVCPVDCFKEGPNFLVIDPEDCIDCAVCIPECPASAIFAEEDVPADQMSFIALNAELTPSFKTISRSKEPLPDSDEWNGKPNKLQYLKRV